MEKHGICALVTHSFAGLLPRLRLGENRKLVGYIGALFHGVTNTMIYEGLTGVLSVAG